MAVVKKLINLDSQLIAKIQNIYGESVSLTYLIENLLWSLVRNSGQPLPSIIEKSAKEAKDEISLSSEILSEDL